MLQLNSLWGDEQLNMVIPAGLEEGFSKLFINVSAV